MANKFKMLKEDIRNPSDFEKNLRKAIKDGKIKPKEVKDYFWSNDLICRYENDGLNEVIIYECYYGCFWKDEYANQLSSQFFAKEYQAKNDYKRQNEKKVKSG